jgi:branched-chain amino acid aminotransferase
MSGRYAFFKGRIVPIEEAVISVRTHAFNYGTGVFEGIRAYWNEEEQQLFIFRPREHYERLLASARMLLMSFPYTPDDLTRITVELLQKEGYREDVYIRPIAYKADEVIGVRLHNLKEELTIWTTPFGHYIEREAAHVMVSSWRRINDNAIPARSKITGAYVNSALAKSEAMLNGFDEAIVLTEDGHVAEGSAENLFIIRNGVLITPPVTDEILEGITRRTIIELAHNELGIRRWSATSIAPSCITPTRCSCAAPASSSSRWSQWTGGRWATGRSGRSPGGSMISTSMWCGGRCRSIGAGASRSMCRSR